jgi:transcriptional regulator with XRE-family HTH domain
MAPKSRNRAPDPIDRHVGGRLRRRRLELGMEATDLDRRIEHAPGTVARFEDGARTIGSGVLFRLGRALDVPVAYFFAGLPRLPAIRDAPLPDPEGDADLARFLRHFSSLRDDKVRASLLRLVRSIADGDFEWD